MLEQTLEAIGKIPPHHNWLFKEVISEITDDAYQGYQHGERGTRNVGCTGPLCKKALRDSMRERVRIRNAMRGRTTRPHKQSDLYIEINPYLDDIKKAYDAEYVMRSGLRIAVSLKPGELQTTGQKTD